MTKQTFVKKWVLANTLGLLIGYILYTPIGHGITGNHGRVLSTDQIIAHSIAVAVVGLILFLFQRSVLKSYFEISFLRISLATLAFTGLFWFGYYQTFIPGEFDYDILLSFLVLGSGLWITTLSFSTNKLGWLIALLSFPMASFIGEVILFVIFSTFDLNMDVQNTTNHIIFWLTVGVTTGLLGGWASGSVLYKMLEKNTAP